jgi:hypothetical protein
MKVTIDGPAKLSDAQETPFGRASLVAHCIFRVVNPPQWSNVNPAKWCFTSTFLLPQDTFVTRCNSEDIPGFERSARARGAGGNFVNLTDEQYARLKRP